MKEISFVYVGERVDRSPTGSESDLRDVPLHLKRVYNIYIYICIQYTVLVNFVRIKEDEYNEHKIFLSLKAFIKEGKASRSMLIEIRSTAMNIFRAWQFQH